MCCGWVGGGVCGEGLGSVVDGKGKGRGVVGSGRRLVVDSGWSVRKD